MTPFSHLTLTSLLGFLSASCAPDFEPYNELRATRVLAVRAEPPELTQGQSTTLDALIYRKNGEELKQTWSLCPWPSNPDQGFQCPVDQALLEEAWKAAGVQEEAPTLSLGEGELGSLTFPGSTEEARALCDALAKKLESSATAAPDCRTRWEWTVRLSVQSEHAHIETVKSVTLLLHGEEQPNQNPELTALTAKKLPLSVGSAPELSAGRSYDLTVELSEDAAETYVPSSVPGQAAAHQTQETLTFTWFVDAGSTDRTRTAYGPDVGSLREGTQNTWNAPDRDGRVRFFVVVRDHRGGVGFREGEIELTQ